MLSTGRKRGWFRSAGLAWVLIVPPAMACAGSQNESETAANDDQPPECRGNVLTALGAGLEGYSNPGHSQTLQMQHERCMAALDRRSRERQAEQDRAMLETQLAAEREAAANRARLQAQQDAQLAEARERVRKAEEQLAREREAMAGSTTYASRAKVSEAQTPVAVLGGTGHNVFLGCMRCGNQNQSILEATGEFGRCWLGTGQPSLFCHGPLDRFGSPSPLSPLSACNRAASDPPVLVDQDGNYYGRLSVAAGTGHPDSVCSPWGRYSDQVVCVVATYVCEHDSIAGLVQQ
jgi:hypothetical protein